MKRLLITGASGFIGGFLVEEALNNGYKVYAGIRKGSDISYLSNKKIVFFEADLSDKNALRNKLDEFDKFDYIIHTAGITKTCNKDLFDTVNFKSTKNLISALQETHKIPDKFIFISSLAAYGPGLTKEKPIELTDEPKPISAYGKSKLKAEKYLQSIDGFPYIIIRPTGVYGPREKDYYIMYKSINNGIESYVGTSKQFLSFIYVKDLTNLLITILNSKIENKSYFASDMKSYTAEQFNQLLKKELDKKTLRIVFPKFLVKIFAIIGEKLSCLFRNKIPTLNTEKYKDISQKNWLCDSSQLKKDFNFTPKYDLEKGLAETIKWYKERKQL